MTRASVFWLRLAVTASLLILVFGLLRMLWYPEAYFELFGVAKLFLMLAFVTLIMGPGLTTLLFRPGKKGLVFDIVVIAIAEVAVFTWAVIELNDRKPVFAVFAVDRFESVRANEVDLEQLRYPELAGRPGHAPRLVYAQLPEDPDAMSRLIDETVFLGMADIDRRPEFWKPYAQGVREIRGAAQPLTELLVRADSRAAEIQQWLDAQRLTAADYLYLPVRGSRADGTMVLHGDIGYPVAVLGVDPW